jgi:hypothetical protein
MYICLTFLVAVAVAMTRTLLCEMFDTQFTVIFLKKRQEAIKFSNQWLQVRMPILTVEVESGLAS